MVVQHNLTAMNANRQLGITTSAQAKSSEKLSSGYRINRAGDDAAGLTISEKMRSQIRGLDKASTNAQDGISLIQSAEGALNESHSILQRMNELAVQGANDTNQSIDRDAINQELEALTDELDRISQTTQFNKQNLLDGTFTNKKLQVGANGGQNIGIDIDKMNATSLGLRDIKYYDGQSSHIYGQLSYNGTIYNWDASKSEGANKDAMMAAAKATGEAAFQDGMVGLSTDGKYFVGSNVDQTTRSAAAAAGKKSLGEKYSKDISTNWSAIKTAAARSTQTVGAFGTSHTLTKPDVSSYDQANATLNAVQAAINKVSTQRSALGALQNRLEHTIANLDTVSENTSAAESRIRDTDMADEMVDYSKNNILAQAGQSMLAQANQINQGVLSLLQ
ncbi:flagellin [Roseburia hominis]|uniref:flagellin N-terminal helical domain-containing protein n=1 Tax=Roseburia hominis TaxID=301301 RepID=UPI001F4132D1|nr:flagellin [Roseburia hominis]